MPMNTAQGPFKVKATALSTILNTNFASASTSYVQVGCTASCVASPGDLIMCTISLIWSNEAESGRADVQTLVAGTPVNSLSGVGLTSTGSDGLYGRPSLVANSIGPLMYIMQPNDIDNGRITCTLMMKTDGGATKTLIGNVAATTYIHLTNFDNVDNRFAKATITGGTGAITSTSYASLTPSITLSARPGDVLIIGADFLWFSEAESGLADVLVTSGANTNYVSGGTSTDQGISQWGGWGSVIMNGGVPITYTVQTNDVTAGNVTLALRIRTFAGGTKNFVGTNPKFWALNLGAKMAVSA